MQIEIVMQLITDFISVIKEIRARRIYLYSSPSLPFKVMPVSAQPDRNSLPLFLMSSIFLNQILGSLYVIHKSFKEVQNCF